MNLRNFAGLVLLASLLINVGSGAERGVRVTGFFSDMRGTPAGDVAGLEVWIVYAGTGYHATVQMSDGEPLLPVVVPVEVSGLKVRFAVRDGASDQVVNFEGTVGKAGLLLSTGEMLKRRSTYWQ